jgi:hypothetical protein
MTLWIAAKTELDAYYAVLRFNDFALGMEIDQARSSPPLSLSLLAACAYGFVALLGARAVQVNAKVQERPPDCSCIVFH